MIMIEVVSTALNNRSGVGNASGKPYSFREQECWVHLEGCQYPQKAKVTLPDDQQNPYPIGRYKPHGDDFQFGKYGDIQLRLKRLVPLQQRQQAAA